MKLTATVKLLPDDIQRAYLRQTLERANAACNYASQIAFEQQVFSQYRLHKLVYRTLRSEYELAAQMAVRCIGKVAESYNQNRKGLHKFKPYSAIAYDDRILNFRLKSNIVSIWVLGGRETIPFVCGEHQRELLPYARGEADLIHRNGQFYLAVTCDVPDDAPIDPEGWLGIDLGIANIATDSDGTFHQGKSVEKVRYRHRRLRTSLQRAQTDSARRHMKRLAGKEYRFATNVNHVISKRIVAKAQGTRRSTRHTAQLVVRAIA